MGPWIRLIVVGMSLAAGVPLLAADAKGPIRLKIIQVVPRPRSQAPQLLELSIENRLPQLVEGELELDFYVGPRRQVMKYRSEPLALAGNFAVQRFRITIPPITVHYDKTPVTIVGRFVTPSGTFELADQDLVVATYWKRWFVIGVSRPVERAVFPDKFGLVNALAFERFNPNSAERLELVTYPTPIAPEAFPVSASAYASFDLLLLEDAGFTQLNEVQLGAIAAWVEAGGVVVVRPTGVLRASQLAFLNRLTAGERDRAPYVLDARGRLDETSAALADPFVRAICGLGRALILHESRSADEDFSGEDWAEHYLFLWRFRRDQAQVIRDRRSWDLKLPALMTDDYREARPYAPQDEAIENRLRTLLIPGRVQGVPFWVVVAILSAFLLAIAPGDYFLLGAIKARRYTWIFMSAISLLFTVGTVRVAERIMGTTDYRQSLVFVDLGPEDRPARTSRFELTFTGTQKVLEAPLKDTLDVPIDDRLPHYDKTMSVEGFYVTPISFDEEQSPPIGLSADLPEYVGRMPGNYAVRQQMRQWSPTVSRRTSFTDPVDVPALDWARLNPATWKTGDEGLEILREELARANVRGNVLMFHHDQFLDLTADVMREAEVDDAPTTDGDAAPPDEPVFPLNELLRQGVHLASVRPDRGFFALVSQVAPTGGHGFEDLSLLDSSDEGQWLLVLVVRRGNDHFVFRKLFQGAAR